MTAIRMIFPQIRALFPIFEKGQGDLPPLPPSSYVPDQEPVDRKNRHSELTKRLQEDPIKYIKWSFFESLLHLLQFTKAETF